MISSPKRLISFVAVIAYYFWVFIRPFSGKHTTPTMMPLAPSPSFHLPVPPIEALDAAAFAGFALISLPLLGQITAYNRTMNAADIDVLFPTPVSPRLVMMLRVIRDYLATLIFPFIIGIFSWRPISVSGIFTDLPHTAASPYFFKFAAIAWFLLALVYTSFGYAATLFVNRSDLASDRNAKILNRAVLAFTLGTLAFLVYRVSRDFSLTGAIALANNPVLRTLNFVAYLATKVAMGPLTSLSWSAVSALALLVLIVIGFRIALSQVTWMYDQAAVRGFETIESMRIRKSGDMSQVIAASARSGKIRAGRQTFLHRMRVKPGAVMVWREAVIQLRSIKSVTSLFFAIALFYSLLPILIFRFAPNHQGETNVVAEGGMFAFFQVMGLFMSIVGVANTGFIELLKRTDLLKPLPFSPGRLMTVEIFSKTYLPLGMSVICVLIGLILDPKIAEYAIGYLLYGPTLAFVLCSCLLTVTLLFPEINDPTQRGFRGLMTMLGLALCVAPGAATYLGMAIIAKQQIAGAALGSLLNAGIALALAAWAGYLYMGFNPTE